MTHYDVIIIGGGAAGFFAAINIAEKNPKLKVIILERGKEGLQKVRISGGGRCNVTHAEFIPSELVLNYPRGEKELLGPFHQFMTGDTIEWFAKRGVELKIEDDGRMFPITDSSKTIIDCFLNEAKKHKVKVLYNQSVTSLSPRACHTELVEVQSRGFEISTKDRNYTCNKLLVATGSNTKIWSLLEGLGYTISQPVPSLFTFNMPDESVTELMGIVVEKLG